VQRLGSSVIGSTCGWLWSAEQRLAVSDFVIAPLVLALATDLLLLRWRSFERAIAVDLAGRPDMRISSKA
jgi:hypothetical protein